MKLPPQASLTDKKYQDILTLLSQLGVDLADIEEKFVRGGGRGGQKINKSSNAVQLKHVPTGMLVKYQKHREQGMNRILALRALLEKLNAKPSKGDLKALKKAKQKKRRARRSETKLSGGSTRRSA
jgi:peptide chain release factor